jgi:hypothetical protein
MSQLINNFMKIAIIGVARSRTTVLTELIRTMHPDLIGFHEFYTYRLDRNFLFENITPELMKNDDFIVKIMSHNIFNYENKIDLLQLEKYDQLYLIERPDFFHLCCSLQVAKDSNIWHKKYNSTIYDKIHDRKFLLNRDTILAQARGVGTYIQIKKYLLDNNINFVLHPYDDTFDQVSKNTMQNPNLDYPNIIENYSLKDEIEQNFKDNFNYTTLYHDYENFCNRL